jgi:hypothetical protein
VLTLSPEPLLRTNNTLQYLLRGRVRC